LTESNLHPAARDEELKAAAQTARPTSSSGWQRRRSRLREPGEIALLGSIDEQDADAEFTGILQAPMTRDRLEFLG
jgi:hypothetical protein